MESLKSTWRYGGPLATLALVLFYGFVVLVPTLIVYTLIRDTLF